MVARDFHDLGADAWLAVIENTADGILIVDRHGRIRFANTAAEELTGKARRELLGKPFGLPVVSGGRAEIEIRRPPADPCVCEMVVSTSRLPDGEAFVVSLRDVTQKKRIAAEQERARREAEAAARAKAALLDMVAHELKSPISVITGYVSMLRSGDFGPAPEGWEEPLRHTSEQAEELKAMLERILTAARLEAGRLPGGRELTDVTEVVRAALGRATGRAALVSADLRIELPQGPVQAEIDPVQIGIVVDNLIDNALKYTTDDPSVEVSVRVAGEHAQIRVLDHGLGIPPAQQPAVFERFRRLPNASEGGRSGTGLGLAIARDLAELNDGTLTIEASLPGEGSCFLLTLPIALGAENG